MIQPLWALSAGAALIARLVLGLFLIRHGVPKLRDLKGTGEWMQSVGFRPGEVRALAAGLLGVVGGAALVLGFFTQPFALLVAAQFAVILLSVKRKEKAVDKELDLVILVLALLLATLGGGQYSLDEYF